jgi:hypothetical protein
MRGFRGAGEPQTGRHAPQVHELGELVSPGKHPLTLWAGSALPGRIELLATDRVWVQWVKVFPNIGAKIFGVQEYLEGDDFWVTWRTRRGSDGNVRASFSCADTPAGHIETGPPNTERDYDKALEGVPAPVIAHEIGEFQVYPNYAKTQT